jgi:hypothetical protein
MSSPVRCQGCCPSPAALPSVPSISAASPLSKPSLYPFQEPTRRQPSSSFVTGRRGPSVPALRFPRPRPETMTCSSACTSVTSGRATLISAITAAPDLLHGEPQPFLRRLHQVQLAGVVLVQSACSWSTIVKASLFLIQGSGHSP